MAKTYSTKSKEIIMKYIQENRDRRFRAQDVHRHIVEQGNTTNLTTVYRNLDKLTEQHILMKTRTPENDSFVYQYLEPQSTCNHHLHMQCSSCGKVIHLECGFMSEIQQHLQAHHGFQLECTTSILTGICDNCRG